jgi:hypothetical protein
MNRYLNMGGTMKKVRFLFYLSGENDKLLSKAIALWSGFWNKKTIPTSHEELEFCNRAPAEIKSLIKTVSAEIPQQNGLCFSSASRGDFIGVRFAPSVEILKHPEKWKYIEVEVEDQTEQKMFESAKSIVGRPYDYIAIFGFCLPWHIQDDHRWYCSECVNWVAYKGGLLNKIYRWSPLASVNLMLKKGFGPLKTLV